MDSIPKFLASLITIILGVLLCVSFIIFSVVVNSARTYHSSVIEEIQASAFAETTIEKCKEAAEKDNYVLSVEKFSTIESGSQNFYKVTLNYSLSAPILGNIHLGEIVGYALTGTNTIDPSVVIPENPETGDVFIYGDYEYRYNMHFYVSFWSEDEDQNGWGARVLDKTKTSYTRPLSMIGDTPVNSLHSTYEDCKNLTKAPAIPDTITDMSRAYFDCINMSDDDIKIPDSVTTLASAFYNCKSENFIEAPEIPNKVTDMTHTFTNCVNLVTPPKISSSVKYLSSTFSGCTSLIEFPDLSSAASLKGMSSAFKGCISLPGDMSSFTIPSTVTTGYSMFENCTQLVSAPVIPKNMTYISSIFSGCTSLTGNVTINCNPGHNDSTNWDEGEEVFKDTIKPIILVGDCSDETKDRLIATANNGNVTKG